MWSPTYLTDGKTQSEGRNDAQNGIKGYTSTSYPNADISANPHHITIDLGEDRMIDQVALYARNDTCLLYTSKTKLTLSFHLQL